MGGPRHTHSRLKGARTGAGLWSRAIVLIMAAGVTTMGGMAFIRWARAQLLDPATLPLRTVKVEGGFHHVRPAEVRKVVLPYVREGFFGVDARALREVVQAMPWVHAASVRCVWPDTLNIRVDEETPVARWKGKGLVNAEGRLFFPDDDPPASELPLFSGPPRTEAMILARYRELDTLVAPLGLHITQLFINERRSWRLTLSNGVRIVLGRTGDLRRMEKFVRFYPGIQDRMSGMIEAVDLRYSNGFAVRWQPDSSAAGAGNFQSTVRPMQMG